LPNERCGPSLGGLENTAPLWVTAYSRIGSRSRPRPSRRALDVRKYFAIGRAMAELLARRENPQNWSTMPSSRSRATRSACLDIRQYGVHVACSRLGPAISRASHVGPKKQKKTTCGGTGLNIVRCLGLVLGVSAVAPRRQIRLLTWTCRPEVIIACGCAELTHMVVMEFSRIARHCPLALSQLGSPELVLTALDGSPLQNHGSWNKRFGLAVGQIATSIATAIDAIWGLGKPLGRHATGLRSPR